MSVVLATLCLNELEWLPRLYEQHKDWPGLRKWVFVEAADGVYADSNPHMISKHNMSVDGTTGFLRNLASTDDRVVYIPFGISRHSDPAKGKIMARRCTLDVAEEVRPTYVIVLDADEFYTKSDQHALISWMDSQAKWHDSFVFPKREIWHPPSVKNEPLMKYEAKGKFWDMPCCHWFKWSPGIQYRDCHNMPQHPNGYYLNRKIIYWHNECDAPQMIHMGYAANVGNRLAKNKYYEDRGEKDDGRRSWYTTCRAEWMKWKPGDNLYKGKVVPYVGPIPEVFR